MSHKTIQFSSRARESISRGTAALADAVRVTFGPKSKCVLIEREWGKPLVCNDGVTIAKEFEPEDPTENPGAHIAGFRRPPQGDAGRHATLRPARTNAWQPVAALL